jgi:hypothetical protein
MASMSTNSSIEANGNIVNKVGKGYCWLWSWKLKWSLEDHDVSYAHEGYEWSSYEFEIIYVLVFYLRLWVHGCGCVYGLWNLFIVFVNGSCFWLVFLGFCEWQRWYFLTFHGHNTMIHALYRSFYSFGILKSILKDLNCNSFENKISPCVHLISV